MFLKTREERGLKIAVFFYCACFSTFSDSQNDDYVGLLAMSCEKLAVNAVDSFLSNIPILCVVNSPENILFSGLFRG